MNYNEELDTIVYQDVQRAEYPKSKPLLDVAAKQAEIAALHQKRPATKQEYLATLATLEKDLAALNAQNEQIRAENNAAAKAVDDAYQAALESARADPEHQWAAIRIVRIRLLAESDWTQITDVPMSEKDRGAWRTYRQALRDLPQDYKDPGKIRWPDPPVISSARE